ncbi:hypothetical protein RsS62_03140 [Rhizobium dioscoreae]|uniref:Uncharacterized protein n=1 Tax=Rhizobium dioscoreae TaxID=2653122 RepID=A0ABQ0Z780_9HYPH|nr:hypothetical protein RsS62_03140 [Rhizobium dioscoreae]GES51186.1 hypothetical protein RsS93_38000 [Rhizobium dioscoreae]GLU82638.1 hypothetical protein Rhsp01_38140 [Rhizobium sp. NBRC 114257]
MPMGAMASGRRAKKAAAEKLLAPGARKIALYGLDIGTFPVLNEMAANIRGVCE